MAGLGKQPHPPRPMARQYLTLKRLKINELPPHPELTAPHVGHKTTLIQFLDNLLTEIEDVDFDAGFTSHGKWHPDGINVDMPIAVGQDSTNMSQGPLDSATAHNHATKSVSISVNQKVKKQGKDIWCARTSHHFERDVKYSELDNLLSRDHSRNEARYTPSVYDANELLTWNVQSIDEAISKLGHKHHLERVQLSIFEMFHKMPEVGGLSLLNDRVFHVLVMTAHATYHTNNTTEGLQTVHIPQSFTAQIPVDFESLSQIPNIKKKSHMKKKGSSQRYHVPSDGVPGAALPTPLQRQKIGKKLTEGNYVSLERLRKASKILPIDETIALDVRPSETEYHHRWDMMTLSDAGGITRMAPPKKKQTEILDAIAADVEYVLKYVADQRQPPSGATESPQVTK